MKIREDGWVAYGGKASKGPADIIALKAGERARLVQVKSDARNPWNNFGPADRAALIEEAKQAGAVAELAWYPPRGRLVFIDQSVWPKGKGRGV